MQDIRMGGFREMVAAAICTLAVLVVLAGPSVVSADPIELNFDPNVTELVDAIGEDISVTVDAAATDLRGFSLAIKYNPDVARPTAITAGSLLTALGIDNHFFHCFSGLGLTDSVIAVDGAALGCSLTGPGEIVRLHFIPVLASPHTECSVINGVRASQTPGRRTCHRPRGLGPSRGEDGDYTSAPHRYRRMCSRVAMLARS